MVLSCRSGACFVDSSSAAADSDASAGTDAAGTEGPWRLGERGQRGMREGMAVLLVRMDLGDLRVAAAPAVAAEELGPGLLWGDLGAGLLLGDF